ncbi:Uncharacterized conserved protein YecE, DUF72 family [Halopseudomonas sabulinigri]|uniref:Uncharacterized conserved protein YecE, DUF72 family n=1 Tax=Halopseudomonas sabulinigri TaxID=472181 RepID=A0A1H1X215_9GAMM|nr:Uncharacterized conserved protein YecE, DUF72 family [Halopseudomonas sabulinigri]
MSLTDSPLRLGCTQWSDPLWQSALYTSNSEADQRLAQYCQVFAAVEGNTTFYSLPSAERVARWAELMPADFRFCAKLPREVSHGGRLDADSPVLKAFFNRMAPLGQRLGPVWLQLPQRFAPASLAELTAFLDALSDEFAYAVEVRHLDFFRKDSNEQQLNRQLRQRGVERVIFDTRALFASADTSPATLEAKARKPRLPVHALALTAQPAVRFVGGMDNDANLAALQPWLDKCTQWLGEGLRPLLFMHTPDNRLAPQLARLFYRQLQLRLPQLPSMPLWPGEIEAAQQPQQAGLF